MDKDIDSNNRITPNVGGKVIINPKNVSLSYKKCINKRDLLVSMNKNNKNGIS
jgi:hypothetical protein